MHGGAFLMECRGTLMFATLVAWAQVEDLSIC